MVADRQATFDIGRIAVATVVTAGLAAGIAAALRYHSSHTAHVGPTSATFSDAAAVIGGVYLGVFIGSLSAAAWVRRGPRLVSGVFVGLLGFVGAAPFVWSTFSSDIGTGEKIGGLAILLIPAVIVIVFGAAIGAAIGAAVRVRQDGAGTPTAD